MSPKVLHQALQATKMNFDKPLGYINRFSKTANAIRSNLMLCYLYLFNILSSYICFTQFAGSSHLLNFDTLRDQALL